jgi:hypothetical protein
MEFGMPLPPLTPTGDLPVGVHPGTLREVIARFGTDSPHRMLVALRLEHVYRLAVGTGHVARFIVFGSFITNKPEPNDVDIFLLMEDSFDVGMLSGETRLLFEHASAQAHFGASIFWMRRLATFDGEQSTVEYWQIKRDRSLRGIVEIVEESP